MNLKFYYFITIALLFYINLTGCFTDTFEQKTIVEMEELIFRKIEPEEKIFNLFGFDKNGYKYGELTLTQKNGYKKTTTWDIYQNPLNKSTISLPSTWLVKQEENRFLLAELDEEGNDYFTWMKHKKSESGITLEQYFNYFQEVVTTDTFEVCNQPIVKQYNFPERIAFYFECIVSSKIGTQICYSFITEDEENVYEFTLKFLSGDYDGINMLIFDTIMNAVYVNGENLLERDNNLPVIEHIEIGIK